MEIINFFTTIPFSESPVFPILMSIIFLASLGLNIQANHYRYNHYKNNMDTLIFDDWNQAKKSVSTPGILMSIGIIGTFYLIYESLSKLNNNIQVESMLNVITNNIAPAFSISAFGISMSILYLFIEYIFIIKPYSQKMKKINLQRESISYVDIATKQLIISRKSLDATEKQTKSLQALSHLTETFQNASLGMEKFGEIASNLEKTLNPQVLGAVISNALTKEMSPILNNIQDITSSVNQNNEKITKFLEEDLKNEVIQPLLRSVRSTDKSTQEMKIVLDRTSKIMEQTNAGFDTILTSLDLLNSVQNSFVNKLDNVLEKQRVEFEKTTNIITKTYNHVARSVKNQTDKFEENSTMILNSFTELSSEMKTFLIEYKNDYKEVLKTQEQAITETSKKAVITLETTGSEMRKTIVQASDKLESTLNGVDDALIKTSKSIQEELGKFKDSYTDSLKGFLDSQEEILNNVFKEQTERLSGVVGSFKTTLEDDVNNRKILNEDLEKLITTTNGFVSSTQTMIATTFDEQQSQLIEFMNNNKSMQSKLTYIIDNATDINDNGNNLTKELIETTAHLSQQFNDNQTKVLKEYQGEVDKHLTDILTYMAAIIEASHLEKNK